VDEADATKIGEGESQQFSPDERSVLSVVHGPPSRVLIQPIGPGEATTVSTGEVLVTDARWLSDGKRLLLVGTEPSTRARAYVMDIAGGTPRPITPEGITFLANQIALSHDAARVAFQSPDGAVMIYSTTGERSLPVAGLQPGQIPIGWTSDDRALVVRDGTARHRLVAVDPTTGRRTLFHEFVQSNLSLAGPGIKSWTRDGRTFAATYQRRTMTVYLIDGLR
jgi:Tol biopolymer transport system component